MNVSGSIGCLKKVCLGPPDVAPDVAISLIAMATMMQSILFTRLFSVTLFYHYAFLVISLTMAGLTAGALIVHCYKQWISEKGSIVIAGAAALLSGMCTLVALVVQTRCAGLTVEGIAAILGNSFLLLPGFVLSGVAVTLLLSESRGRENIRYAADMVGAALGCVTVLVWLEWLGVLNSLLCTVGVYTIAAYICGAQSKSLRRGSQGVLAVLTLILAMNSGIIPGGNPLLSLRYIQGIAEEKNDFERWNAYSRVTAKKVTKSEEPRLKILIDNKASTWIRPYPGDPAALHGVSDDVRFAAYQLRPVPSVMVIGVGGGLDIQAALVNNVNDITGLEVNDGIYYLLTRKYADFSGNLGSLPGVHLINDEGRAYSESHPDTFGYIEINNISTWAATSAGAFILSESGLYTVEAWRTFWNRLNPNGLMSFMRPYNPRHHTGELYRMLSLAHEVLLREGIEHPEEHVIVALQDDKETAETIAYHLSKALMIVSRTPISQQEYDHFMHYAVTKGYSIPLAPFGLSSPEMRQIITGGDVAALENTGNIDLSPPTDDRPFFFQLFSFRQALKAVAGDYPSQLNGALKSNLYAVQLLFYILAALSLLVVAMFWPLWKKLRSGQLTIRADELGYFLLIGFGFMLLEIGFLQRFTLFLGRPTYALSVVLSVLLLSSGLGSWTTRKAVLYPQIVKRVAVICGALIITIGCSAPLLDSARQLGEAWRIIVTIGLIFTAGFFMGMALPLGINLLGIRNKADLVPWLWGINSAVSVSASVLGIILSLFWGTNATLWLGVFCYVFLYWGLFTAKPMHN